MRPRKMQMPAGVHLVRKFRRDEEWREDKTTGGEERAIGEGGRRNLIKYQKVYLCVRARDQ